MSKPKIALVHEWFIDLTGSEKVVEAIYEIFPAPIYTLIKDKKSIKGTIFENAKIYTSFIQRLPASKKIFRTYFPLFPLAIEQFDLSGYDLIISSSHSVAKGILTNYDQIHVCYCHTPMRYAWDLRQEYLKGMNPVKSFFTNLLLHYIRMWDFISSTRVDYFIANSRHVARRIKKIYRRDSTVIYPPVDIDKFELYKEKEDFYITISRLVPYKRIDLIVKAFSKINKKLIIIGDGPDKGKIKRLATDNIKILGYQPFSKLRYYLQRAKAFVFAANEDFGISLIEAQACGTPVIAFGKGGAKEAVIEGETGLFFYKQEPEAIIEVIKEFERIKFDPLKLRKNAEKFSKKRFKEEFSCYIKNILSASPINSEV